MFMQKLAGWQSGYAAACKAVNSGSIPDSASIMFQYTFQFFNIILFNNKMSLIIVEAESGIEPELTALQAAA